MANEQITWDGWVIRTDGSDDGTIPRVVTSNSPDIICSGSRPPTNPDQYVDPANYTNEYSNCIYENISNYFYIRAKNYRDGKNTGYLHTYWTPSNLILLPFLWKDNYMLSSSEALGIQVNAEKKGDIVANTGDAFTWIPNPPEAGTHYCLMCQISDSIDPALGIPTQNFERSSQWADWLAQRGNWGWRNTVYITDDHPDVPPTTDHHIVIPGKKTDPWQLYNLYIECVDVPVGWSFQFSSGTTIPMDPKYPNAINTLTKSKTDVRDGNENIGAHWLLPPQFNTNISVSVWFNGIPPKSTTKWQLRINEVSNDDTLSIYRYGIDLMEYPNPHPTVNKWLLYNANALKKDMPIGKEIEIGNINFRLNK